MTEPALRLVLRAKSRWSREPYQLLEMRPDGSDGAVLATVRTARMLDRTGLVFYADEGTAQPLFAYSGAIIREKFEIVDSFGMVLGSFHKVWKSSVLRSTWQLATVDGMTAVGRERNKMAALMRRFDERIPFVGVHFDFTTDDGQLVLSSTRRRTIIPEYEITVPTRADGRRLDWRVAAAVGVALEAEQDR
ncbi:hypothetical protein [Aeromicrobium wangtongii]|uniref:Scramblase n=1 Tax=Aeromicrobium wangtongii TaxID=2969247 RepID=A0ABY5M8V0_9ACTN|nr:hypothetical protein [Aeromicrobium wangtongii]MCD9199524.1 hypothetical protein [Aeromicrobium wangtongii]UUP13877.1 hypothetical protein NQV15_00780 [Aeromicrobium wangtongii]